MEGIFQEFENENSLRSYPFAAGCEHPEDAELEIPAGVFVDAALYPLNPSGTLYLSGVSADGVFSISDDSGVVMTGVPYGRTIEFFDPSSFRRHAGTMIASSEDALSEFAARGSDRSYSRDVATFASSCVCPVVIDGVTSLSIGGAGAVTGDAVVSNGPNDDIRASVSSYGDGRTTIRFDILPRPGDREADSIKRIICVVDGQTPFRIERLAYNIVMVSLAGIDKGAICAAAHRENEYEMADTCECDKTYPGRADPVPETYQIEEVFIPPDEGHSEGGLENGADNAFWLVVPNIIGYDNPLSITMEEGMATPNTDGPEVVVDGNSANLADGALVDDMTSNGIVIQVPGLSGGMI